MVLRRNSLLSILLLCVSVVIISPLHAQHVEKMMGKELQRLWDCECNIEQLSLDQNIVSRHPEIQDGDLVYSITGSVDGSSHGYAIFTSAMGRFEKFDYFVIYDTALVVKAVRIVEYRSSYGSAICNKRWLKQFVDFKGENLVYGKDIQAVSGATISGQSIVKDMLRGSYVIRMLRAEEII